MAQDFYEVLKFNDQLFIEKNIGNIPRHLKQGNIEFAPTFKRKVGSNTEFKMKRNPSWTDRVLYHFDPAVCDVVLKSYDSHNLVGLSDHKPVFAQFLVTFDLHGDFKEQKREQLLKADVMSVHSRLTQKSHKSHVS